MPRQLPARLLTHRVTVSRPTASYVSGETRLTSASVATGVPCTIQHGRGRREVTHRGTVLSFDAEAYFRPDVDLRPNAGSADAADRLIVETPSGEAGQVYQVVHVADEGGRAQHRTAFLLFVGAGTS